MNVKIHPMVGAAGGFQVHTYLFRIDTGSMYVTNFHVATGANNYCTDMRFMDLFHNPEQI
ncbi:MAG TPA: hypothetical protein EYO45_06535 [Candidatus Marinimicrobia bacterium]|nr:hypothetical protein [Candidatus Neomarinimicrobiota bacterium]